MAKRAKRRRSRTAEAHRAESTNAGSKPEVPQDLAMIAWLLAPEGIETLRRQLIDGKAGQIEPLLYTFAYSGPLEPERTRPRWVRAAQFWAEPAGHAPPDPPKADDRKPSNPGGEKIGSASGYQINWDKVVLDLRRRARALVEDPAYQESRRRRLTDGKAPRMMALLLRWPEKKSRDPYERRRGKPPLTIVMDHLPGEYDPLAEREGAMIEAQQADEALQARVREGAGIKQAAAAPPEDPPDPDALELYQPEP